MIMVLHMAAAFHSLYKVSERCVPLWIARYVHQLLNVGALSDTLNHSGIWREEGRTDGGGEREGGGERGGGGGGERGKENVCMKSKYMATCSGMSEKRRERSIQYMHKCT